MNFLTFAFVAGVCCVQTLAAPSEYQLRSPSAYGPPPSYAPAPSYGPPPSYAQPAVYSPPAYVPKPSYGPVHAGPSTSYSYPSPSPPVKCPTNLLLSCAPSVAPVPCQSVSYAPSYPAPKPTYSAPPAPAY